MWGDEPDDDARRSADAEIQRRMAEAAYDVRSAYGRALVKIVTQVVSGDLGMLVRSDHLFARADRLRVTLPQPVPPSWPEASPSLIYEAATAGAPRFVADKLRCWDPAKGASLRTYATNFVLMYDFCAVYRRYHRAEAPRPQECALPRDVSEHVARNGTRIGRDPLDTVLHEDVLRCLRDGCWTPRQIPGHDLIEIIALRYREENVSRIGRELGLDRRTVAASLRDFRRHLSTVHGWAASTSDGGEHR